MEVEKNVWLPMEVQGISIGQFINVYEETDRERYEYFNANTWLVRKYVEKEEHVTIDLLSDQVGMYHPQLVLETPIFKRLYGNEFTRIVDYFLLARNCVSVYGEDGKYISYDDDSDMKCYHFNAKLPNGEEVKFWFVIDFSLQ